MSHENNNNKKDKNLNINRYNPDQERCCRGCYKTIKTKEGVLENEYKFACGPCHNWYKKAEYTGITLVILLGISVILFVIWDRIRRYD